MGLTLEHRLAGLMLGIAVGDSLGLPAEGLSRGRIERRWKGVWKQRFLFGRGMCSDDTEHAFFVAQALLASADDPAEFQKLLAWKLRFWLLGLPAGIGFATLRAIIKLWFGFPPSRSGVFSAGNGPAMRSAIIGAYFADQPAARKKFVSASTKLTHTDPKADIAALAIAEAAAWAVSQNAPVEELLAALRNIDGDAEWVTICERLKNAYRSGITVRELAEQMGLGEGVTGYSYHSVPIALFSFIRQPDDFRGALTAALDCGGDTDTVGAIVGALCGARVGAEAIPAEWLTQIWDWPRNISVMRQAAERLATQKEGRGVPVPVQYPWPLVILRNLLFTVTVLAHAILRFFH